MELTNEIATLRSQNAHSDNQVTDLQNHHTTDDGLNRLESNNGTLHRLVGYVVSPHSISDGF